MRGFVPCELSQLEDPFDPPPRQVDRQQAHRRIRLCLQPVGKQYLVLPAEPPEGERPHVAAARDLDAAHPTPLLDTHVPLRALAGYRRPRIIGRAWQRLGHANQEIGLPLGKLGEPIEASQLADRHQQPRPGDAGPGPRQQRGHRADIVGPTIGIGAMADPGPGKYATRGFALKSLPAPVCVGSRRWATFSTFLPVMINAVRHCGEASNSVAT